MGYIDFAKLKARVPIARVLDHFGLLGELSETPQGYAGVCPFCGSNAFKVNTEKNVWFCFGECKTQGDSNGGNILDFVSRKERVAVKTAATRIAEWFPENQVAARTTPVEGQMKATQAPSEKARMPEQKGEGGSPATMLRSETPIVAISEGARNKPLGFTLKSIDFGHQELDALGLKLETLESFGVGYFTGKGIMHDKVVIPFHNADGLLVAYAGYSPRDGTITYPEKFDPRLELYNCARCAQAEGLEQGIIVVMDLLRVLQLYEQGMARVVAIPTEKLFAPQRALLKELIGSGGVIDFVPSAGDYIDILASLVQDFHTRLHRNTDLREGNAVTSSRIVR